MKWLEMKWLDRNSQVYSWFSPYPLFLGISLSFLACSIVGRDISRHNIFKEFYRFHYYISPESLFYPTSRQLLELSEAEIDKSKIAVIIGGSSVFNGVGQSQQDLWSNQLQRELGSRYEVLNLAFRGGGYQEHGAIAAEMLLQRGYKVIYVADTLVSRSGPPDYLNSIHRYILWDTYYKGLLPKYKRREDYLRHSLSPFSEVRLNAKLDSIVYANDFWSSIGYEYFFTVWSFVVAGRDPAASFYLPRKNYSDSETVGRPKPAEERFSDLNALALDANRELQLSRWLCQRNFTVDSTGNWVETWVWDDLEKNLKIFFPAKLRKRSLIVVMHRNSLYFSQMSAEDKSCLERTYALTKERFRSAGFASVEVGKDFVPDDYADQVHLVVNGGYKLSKEVAAEVKRMAKELGYED